MSYRNSSAPAQQRTRVKPSFDPLIQPVVESHALPRLDDATMQLEFIRGAFSRQFHWQVEPMFQESFRPEIHQYPDVVPAAVFFPLVQRASGLHVLLTRRASHLYDHAGQVAFPGGRIETTDADAIAAALRETNEEIGVASDYIRVIGTQPGFLTSTRFTMVPVIGHILPGFTVNPDASEVAEVFEVPLSYLMDTSAHKLHRATLPDGSHRYYFSISWSSYFIWGATAALIRNFYHYLLAAQGAATSAPDSEAPHSA